jgi:hypothetical protein
MLTYPEPTMPRSTRHLEERAADQPISAERAAAITRSIRHIANHVRALRVAASE